MTTALFTVAATVLPLVALMACPAKHLPSYRRGGWGKFAA